MICGRTLVPLNPRIPTLPRKCQASFGVSLTEDGAQRAVATRQPVANQAFGLPLEESVEWPGWRRGVFARLIASPDWSTRQLSAWGRFQVPSGAILEGFDSARQETPGKRTWGDLIGASDNILGLRRAERGLDRAEMDRNNKGRKARLD